MHFSMLTVGMLGEVEPCVALGRAAATRCGRAFQHQPFWGQRVTDLGVGPQPIPYNRLSVERLSAAIREAVNTPAMRERATALGKCIRLEDGVARAVDELERYLSLALN